MLVIFQGCYLVTMAFVMVDHLTCKMVKRSDLCYYWTSFFRGSAFFHALGIKTIQISELIFEWRFVAVFAAYVVLVEVFILPRLLILFTMLKKVIVIYFCKAEGHVVRCSMLTCNLILIIYLIIRLSITVTIALTTGSHTHD